MPTIGRKHLELTEREKGEKKYQVHCMEKKCIQTQYFTNFTKQVAFIHR